MAGTEPRREGREVQLQAHVAAPLRVQDVVAPGGRVRHGGGALGDAEPGAHAGPHGVPVRGAEGVVAGTAGLRDQPVVAEGPAQQRGARRVRGEQHVPAGDVVRRGEHGRRARLVAGDPLQRRPVPGLQVQAAGRLAPVGRQVLVGDDDVGALQHRRGGRAAGRRGAHAGGEAVLVARRGQPDVLGAVAAREQRLVQGPGAVAVPPVEAVVDDPHRRPPSVRGRLRAGVLPVPGPSSWR